MIVNCIWANRVHGSCQVSLLFFFYICFGFVERRIEICICMLPAANAECVPAALERYGNIVIKTHTDTHTHSFAQTMCKLSKNSIGFDIFFCSSVVRHELARALCQILVWLLHIVRQPLMHEMAVLLCTACTVRVAHNETLFGAHTTLFLVIYATRQRVFDTHSKNILILRISYWRVFSTFLLCSNIETERNTQTLHLFSFIIHFSASLAWLENMPVHRAAWTFKMSSFR